MLEEENLTLKNKIVELKERLSQIYSHAAADANKSKAFESEFSLYLKACEYPWKERMDGIILQHNATKFGMVILAIVLAFTAYVFNGQILSGIVVLLGFGFIACGLMYLLLEGEIRIRRAGDYCAQLEAYFMQHRWTSEQNESANLPKIPLWEEHKVRWEKDLFAGGPYEKTAVYAPLRVALTLADLSAFVALLYYFVAHRSDISWVAILGGSLAWSAVVLAQMLLVQAIVDKVERKLERGHESHSRYQGTMSVRRPGLWVNILRLFFMMDIIFPEDIGKRPE